MAIKRSNNNPDRYLVTKPGEPTYIATYCMTCYKLTPIKFVKDYECRKCTRSAAA